MLSIHMLCNGAETYSGKISGILQDASKYSNANCDWLFRDGLRQNSVICLGIVSVLQLRKSTNILTTMCIDKIHSPQIFRLQYRINTTSMYTEYEINIYIYIYNTTLFDSVKSYRLKPISMYISNLDMVINSYIQEQRPKDDFEWIKGISTSPHECDYTCLTLF